MSAALVAAWISAGCGGEKGPPPPADAGPAPPDAARAADAGPATDAGPVPGPDAGAPDVTADLPPRRPPPPDGATEPYLLSQTGLYADFARRIVAPGLVPFEPTHELWSDGARKRRWIELPAGATIDTSDMDHWSFPVGTRAFKEFSRNGVPLETRLIERTGPGPDDYWMGAFIWRSDGTDAVHAVDGARDVNGTDHDVPATKDCAACHGGAPGKLLGFSAVQLSGGRGGDAGSGASLEGLVAAGRLSAPPGAATAPFVAPGPPEVARALGYLHANCGHCHDRKGLAYRDTDLVLRLSVSDRQPDTTGAYRTAIGVKMQKTRANGAPLRITPGDPAASGVIGRMNSRERVDQMPPLATEHVDPLGVDIVSTWIRALPR